MRDEIIVAGYGGQGIVLAGSLIANAAVKQGIEICGMVSYGAEMRGGTSTSSVIISDQPISSPVILRPTSALIMNQPSLEEFEPKIQKDGLLVLNVSECRIKPARKDLQIVEIAANDIAAGLGNLKAANLVMVGAYLKKRNILKLENAIAVLQKVLPKARKEMIELNTNALKKGYEVA